MKKVCDNVSLISLVIVIILIMIAHFLYYKELYFQNRVVELLMIHHKALLTRRNISYKIQDYVFSLLSMGIMYHVYMEIYVMHDKDWAKT